MKILLFLLTLCVGLNANDLLNNLSEYDKKRVIIAVANCFRENPHIRREVLEIERGIKNAQTMQQLYALKDKMDSVGYDMGVHCSEYQNGVLLELVRVIAESSGTTRTRYSIDFLELLIAIANNLFK